MDADLEQDYISIVQTMREQIAVLKAKLTVQQSKGQEEDWERSHSKEAAALVRELRQLKEEERLLRRELQTYGEVGEAEEGNLQEIQRLSEELANAKAEFEEIAGKAKSQHHSPANSRLNYVNKKLATLTAENIELSQRLSLLEEERKVVSEQYTAAVSRGRSEDKMKLRVKHLEQVIGQKDREIDQLEAENSPGSVKFDQIQAETSALSLQLQQLQTRAAQLESAETAALQSSSVAQKLKAEVKQLEVTLLSKQKLLKVKEEELSSFQAQYERLKAELELVNEENHAFKLSLIGTQAVASSLNPTPKGAKAHFRLGPGPAPQTKSADRLGSKPNVQAAAPLFAGSYARLHASRSRENKG